MALKFGMGFLGGLNFGAGIFWGLIFPPFDHPCHLKSRVPPWGTHALIDQEACLLESK